MRVLSGMVVAIMLLASIGGAAANKASGRVEPDITMTVVYESHVVVPQTPLGQVIKPADFPIAHQDINENNFPAVSEEFGDKRLVLVQFSHGLGTDMAIQIMHKNGLRPATVRQLVEWESSRWNRDYHRGVVALGNALRLEHSAAVGGPEWYFPYLGEYAARPMLDLRWSGNGWSADWYFLTERM